MQPLAEVQLQWSTSRCAPCCKQLHAVAQGFLSLEGKRPVVREAQEMLDRSRVRGFYFENRWKDEFRKKYDSCVCEGRKQKDQTRVTAQAIPPLPLSQRMLGKTLLQETQRTHFL